MITGTLSTNDISPSFPTDMIACPTNMKAESRRGLKRSQSPLFESIDEPSVPKHKRSRTIAPKRLNYVGKPVEPFDGKQPFDYSIHEAVPSLPSNHPDFIRAENEIDNVVRQMVNGLKEVSEHQEFNKVLNTLMEAKRTHKLLTVGIVGNSGVGKSSFINALLGVPSAALANDGGAAVTQVVTEYEDHPSQICRFEADVIFKSKKAIDAEIRGHFHNYIDGLQPMAEQDGDSEVDDGADMKRKADTARDILMQLFGGDVDGFADEDELEERMRALPQTKYPLLLMELQANIDNKIKSLSADRVLTLFADDFEAGQDQVKAYTAVAEIGEQGWWPVVQKVRTRLDCPLLRQGFKIADCPGLSDSNTHRRTTTQVYLRSCAAVIIVGDIQRILTDDAIQSYVNTYVLHKGPHKVLLVPTKADVIEHDPDKPSKEYKSLLRRLDLEVKNCTTAWRKNKDGEREKAARTIALTAQRRCRILCRNAKVLEHAQALLSSESQRRGETLPVFPTSSNYHLSWINGEADESTPLRWDEDGIANVRSHLVEIAQAGRFEALQRYINETFKVSLNRALLILQKSPTERKEDCILAAQNTYRESTGDAMKNQGDIRRAFEKHLIGGMRARTKTSSSPWPRLIESLLDQWRAKYKNANTMRAFCKNLGIHKPKGAECVIEWNKEVIEQLLPELKGLLGLFNQDLMVVQHEIKGHAQELFEGFENTLSRNDLIGGLEWSTFWNNFKAHGDNFDVGVGDLIEGVFNALCETVTDATGEDPDTRFNKSMATIYNSTLTDVSKGPKVTLRRWDYLFTHITAPSKNAPFKALEADISAGFEAIRGKLHSDLCKVLEQPMQHIKDDLTALFGGACEEDWQNIGNRELLEEHLTTEMQRAGEKLAQIEIVLEGIKKEFAGGKSVKLEAASQV